MFSVIIPVFNRANYIEQCVRSVLAQQEGWGELILVDDNSSDGSYEIMRRITDSRVVVLRRESAGPGGYAARNLGISHARYEYVAFLDADDAWEPDHLSNMAKLVRRFPCAHVFASGYQVAVKGGGMPSRYYSQHRDLGVHSIDFSGFMHAFLYSDRFTHTSVTIVRKDALLKIGGFPEGRAKKGGDLYTWIKLMAVGTAAWSPHLGATVTHTAPNRVSSNNYFDPLFLRSWVDELAPNLAAEETVLLCNYVNNLLFRNYFRMLARNEKVIPPHQIFLTGPASLLRRFAIEFTPKPLVVCLNSIRKSFAGKTKND